MFGDILVPTDGSSCAESAVEYAVELGSRYDASVHVVSVVDSRTLENAPHYEDVKDECAAIASETAGEVAAAGVESVSEVRTAVPHEGILSFVEEEGMDLVVMGTHGRTGVDRILLGSVTEKVLRLSDVPLLTVHEHEPGDVTYPFEEILVPTDGSAGAAAAVEYAVDVAQTYGARVHAVSVVDTVSMGMDPHSSGVLDVMEESAEAAVQDITDRVADLDGVAVETAVEFGNPYQNIQAYVADHGIDLVVMGTHGRSGLERYLLGSVTEKTVRTSTVPVMTVRQPED